MFWDRHSLSPPYEKEETDFREAKTASQGKLTLEPRTLMPTWGGYPYPEGTAILRNRGARLAGEMRYPQARDA